MLGVSYDYGDDVPKDRVQPPTGMHGPRRRTTIALELNLGIILAHKRKPQFKEAIRLYKLAAAQGNRNAKYNLGMYYAEGRGIRRDPQKAFEWYLGAAHRATQRLRTTSATAITKAKVSPEISKSPWRWYRKASRAGNMFAMYNLGLCYKFGDGVPKSLPLARRHFRAAAAAGHTGARRQLRSCTG